MTELPPPEPGHEPDELARPLYSADVGQAFVRFWKKFVTFSGRASPSEFWWWFLVSGGIASSFDGAAAGLWARTHFPTPGTDPRQYLQDMLRYDLALYTGALVWLLVTLIGQVAVGVRRLHDTGRSGWWCLLALVPVLGWIVLLVFWAEPPQRGGRRYDPRLTS